MSEFDRTADLEPDDQPDPEEFEGTEPGAESEDTGTQYDELGEPEATPRDADTDDDEPDE